MKKKAIIGGTSRHDLLVCDPCYGFFWINGKGEITKSVEHEGAHFDVWQLPDGSVLFPHYSCPQGEGLTHLNADGSLRAEFPLDREIFSCQPLPNGNYLTGELYKQRVIEFAPDGRILTEIPLYKPDNVNGHECMRMVRKTRDSYLVFQTGINQILRFSFDGKLQKIYHVHSDSFGMVELPNRHILYTSYTGAYEIDEEGHEVWSLKDEDIPDIRIRWLLGVQILSNGNYVFANWMGHGHKDDGMPFFEVTPDKKVVWTCDTRGILNSPSTFQVLEEDPAVVCYRPTR